MAKKVLYHGPGDYVADQPGETLSFEHWGYPVDVNSGEIDDGNGGVATYTGFANLGLSKFADTYFDYLDGAIHGGKGNDILVDAGGLGTLYGGRGDDQLFAGQNGSVAFYGGLGNDILDGFATLDMTGGKGHDTFVLDCETFLGESVGGVTVHDFHHGVDHIEFSTIGTNPSLTNEGDSWTVHTDLGNSTFKIAGVTHLDTTDYAFVINGDSSDNTLNGTNADDILNGFGGNDTLNGFQGNDTLDGGTGIDQMNGGSGNDTFLFSDFTDHIDGGSGFDTISFAKTNQGITLTNASWNSVGGSVTQVEAITGSEFADHIDQTGSDTTIHGKSGNDFLTGDHLIYGDAGNDRIAPQGLNQFGSHTVDVYGGSGHDTFEIDYVYALHNFTGENAVVHDFTRGSDHLEFDGGHNATLSNVGDIWTIHDADANTDTSFELVGIKHLDSSDYIFV